MIPVSELEAARKEHALPFFKIILWTFVQMDRIKLRITSVLVHTRREGKLTGISTYGNFLRGSIYIYNSTNVFNYS